MSVSQVNFYVHVSPSYLQIDIKLTKLINLSVYIQMTVNTNFILNTCLLDLHVKCHKQLLLHALCQGFEIIHCLCVNIFAVVFNCQ